MRQYRIRASYRGFSILAALLTVFSLTRAGFIRPASASASGGLSVHAVIPDNQVDKSQTYFDLRLEPSQKQTVQLIVKNSGSWDATANVTLNAASTGRDGLIVYSQPDVRDGSMKISVTDVARVTNPRVIVPAGGTSTVDIDISMSGEAFDGVILGGLVVAAENQAQQQNTREGVQISNEYSYTIGLKITQNDNAVRPELHLKGIRPGLVNYHTAVIADLQNSEAAIIKNMSVSAQVYRQGSQDVLRDLTLARAEMAPNSTGEFVIDWKDEAIQPGKYRLKMKAQHEGRVWEWDEEFTILAADANETNNNSVGVQKPAGAVWPYVVIGVLALIILLMLAFYIGRRNAERGRK